MVHVTGGDEAFGVWFLDRNIRFRASQEDFWQKVSEKVSLKHKEQPQTKKIFFHKVLTTIMQRICKSNDLLSYAFHKISIS